MEMKTLEDALDAERKRRKSRGPGPVTDLPTLAIRRLMTGTERITPRKTGFSFWDGDKRHGTAGEEWRVQKTWFDQGIIKVRHQGKIYELWMIGVEIPLKAPKTQLKGGEKTLRSGRRIDLLALDDKGCVWIIELKDPTRRSERNEGILECALYSVLLKKCRDNVLDEALKTVSQSSRSQDMRGLISRARATDGIGAFLINARARRNDATRKTVLAQDREADKLIRAFRGLRILRGHISTKF